MQKKLWPFLLAFSISIIFALPHSYGYWKYGNSYSPLIANPNLPIQSEETYTYAPQVHQILKGYWRGDPYIWEYRNSPSPYVGELASIFPLVFLSRVAGSVEKGFVLADFIFPSFLVIYIIFFLRKLGYSHYFSLAASAAVTLTPFFSMLFPKIQSYGTLLTGTSFGQLFLSRTPHPQVSIIFLFLSLFLTAQVINGRKTGSVYWWAFTIGVSLYSSIYVASTIATGILFIIPNLIKKVHINNLIFYILIILAIASPFLVNSFQERSLFANSDFLTRFSFPKDFMFPSQVRYIFIAILFILIKRNNLSKIIFAYVLAASLLIDFHQLIFRVNIQADHWLSRILAPLGTFTLFLIFDEFIVKSKKYLWLCVAIVLVVIGFYRQFTWLKAHNGDLAGNPEHQEIIGNIFAQTKQNDVIGTFDSDLSDEIVGITGRWIYIPPGDRSWISMDEAGGRICTLATQMQGDLKQSDSLEAVNYFLALESRNYEKVIEANEKVSTCIKNQSTKETFKLDYYIAKPDGKLKLIKL